TRFGKPSNVVESYYCRYSERSGDYCRVRSQSTDIGCEAQHMFEIEFRNGRRPNVLGDDDYILIELRKIELVAAGEYRQEPGNHILEIRGALAKVRIVYLLVSLNRPISH